MCAAAARVTLVELQGEPFVPLQIHPSPQPWLKILTSLHFLRLPNPEPRNPSRWRIRCTCVSSFDVGPTRRGRWGDNLMLLRQTCRSAVVNCVSLMTCTIQNRELIPARYGSSWSKHVEIFKQWSLAACRLLYVFCAASFWPLTHRSQNTCRIEGSPRRDYALRKVKGR